jgi:hypothetical protein
LLNDPGLGFLFALLSLSLWLVAQGLARWGKDQAEIQADFDQSLYRKPLHIVAVVLASSAASQQLALVWGDPLRATTLMPIVVLFLASADLLLVNHTLGHPSLSLTGTLLTALAVLWTQAAYFHPLTAFSLWPGGRAFTDQWLTLSLLAVGLASLAQAVGRNPRWEKLYTPPLFSAAVLLAGWALLGSLMLFALGPSQSDFFLSGVFLTLTVFSLFVLRSSDWSGFPWVAGLTLTCVGLSFNAAWARTTFLLPTTEYFWPGQSLLPIPTAADLLWLNLLLQIVPWWRKQGQVVSVRLGWQQHDLAAPGLFWPTAFLLSWLLWFAIAQTLPLLFLTSSANVLFLSSAAFRGSLLTLSFYHLLWLHRTAWATHVTLCSLFLTLLTAWLVNIPQFFHLPLSLAL